MECTVIANKGIGIDLKLAGDKSITVPAGGSVTADLTGDQIGHTDAYLKAQATAEKFGPDLAGGHVVCKARTAPPQKGSKRWLATQEEKKTTVGVK